GAQPLAADWYRGDGPMARTVADAALLAGVMVGLHPSDHATIDSTGFLDGFDPTSTEAADRLRGRRVGLCLRLGGLPGRGGHPRQYPHGRLGARIRRRDRRGDRTAVDGRAD